MAIINRPVNSKWNGWDRFYDLSNYNLRTVPVIVSTAYLTNDSRTESAMTD